MNKQALQATYIGSAAGPTGWPPADLPEIVLLGKSNVGKSSFINALLGRRNLAYVGQTPGKTRLLNFYEVNNQFRLVDAPGYGYARRSQSELQHYQRLMEDYLGKRTTLKGSFLILDSRHQPTQDDHLMFDYLKYFQLPVQLVLTKADKLGYQKQQQQLALIAETFGLTTDQLFLFSAKNRLNVESAWRYLEAVLQLDK